MVRPACTLTFTHQRLYEDDMLMKKLFFFYLNQNTSGRQACRKTKSCFGGSLSVRTIFLFGTS